MARQRSHSIEFKRQVAQEFIAGESLYALSKRHDIARQLIRVWVQKYEAGGLDEDAQAADLLQEYEAKIAALERMVGATPLTPPETPPPLWPQKLTPQAPPLQFPAQPKPRLVLHETMQSRAQCPSLPRSTVEIHASPTLPIISLPKRIFQAS